MIEQYHAFLKTKQPKKILKGFICNDLNDNLFDYQKEIVKWALRIGNAALFEDTGLGKTIQQLSWADAVAKYTNGKVLILAPLAVAKQTADKEAKKFNIKVKLVDCQDDVENGINITNYEKIHKFDTSIFDGVVLDESSILKSYSGSTTKDLIDRFENTRFKLCCTATPSPNDYTEIGTTSEFLGIMPRTEMLSTYFINDSIKKKGKQNRIGWRLKKHAEKDFFKWMATWSMMIDNPSNIGFDGTKYILPKLNIREITIKSEAPETSLFVEYAETLSERREARKESVNKRVEIAKKIAESVDQCLVWCDYNYESELLHKTINDSVEVKGSDTPEHKEKAMMGFTDNTVKYLVSKPSICGFGMNWQNCNNMIFCGLSDSYEQFYQAIRRCYRFGQEKEVNVYVIISEKELNVLQNIKRKQSDHDRMKKVMIEVMSNITKCEMFNLERKITDYKPINDMVKPSFLG